MIREDYAKVSWTLDDILQQAGIDEVEMSEDEAEELLAESQDTIMDAMTVAGWVVVKEIVQEFKRKI